MPVFYNVHYVKIALGVCRCHTLFDEIIAITDILTYNKISNESKHPNIIKCVWQF